MIIRPIRTQVEVLLAAAVLSLAVGCGADDPQMPPVPPVESPKVLVGLDPCLMLDGAAHGLDAGVPGQDDLGANCRWRGRDASTVRLTAFTSGAGLSDLTRDRDPATARVRLMGYPALETFTESGEFCRYDVGIAQDQAIVATMEGGSPDSCTALQKLLTVVVSRLPESG